MRFLLFVFDLILIFSQGSGSRKKIYNNSRK